VGWESCGIGAYLLRIKPSILCVNITDETRPEKADSEVRKKEDDGDL